MKKVFLMFIAAVMLFATGCYKDDIDDLNNKYDELSKEQQRQAEVLKNYQTLLNALNAKLTVTDMTETSEGYKITFSDGSTMTVKHGTNGTDGTNGNDGQNGADGKNAPAIVSVEELNGEVFFKLNDGTVIKLRKLETMALYILSEGTWGGNNSDLAYYDLMTGTITKKYFSAQNGATLGDTGNDLKLYGSKMYCVVSGSDITVGGFIKVIDPRTGKLIKSITATDAEGKPDMPRRMTTVGGKVYVTAYSGSVIRIDTLALEIDGRAKLDGAFPEGICTYGNNLYVCNSGQGPGNTISVIDLTEFKETKTIATANNPMMIEATSTGDIYFTTADYTWGGGSPSGLHRFNVSDPSNIKTFNIRASRLSIGKDYVYTVDTDWDGYSSFISKVNLKTGAVSDFISDGTDVFWGYSVSVNPTNGDVYFMQTLGDWVYRYDSAGKLQGTYFKAGVQNGSSIVFINR